MKHFNKLKFLMVLLLLFGYQGMAQTRGRVTNVLAEQRVDGSDIIDVYYNLAGFSDNYIVSAELFHNNSHVGTIDEEWCTGDFGPGILPGDNKYFEYNIGMHKPEMEWSKTQIEVRVYFPMGDPCPGQEFVSYLGKNYNTIQIGGQCWLKENLDAGTQIDYEVLPWQGGDIEKYCYDNDPENCETYGGLYHWWEAMFYGQGLPGSQGICPQGYHIPTNYEFDILVDLFGGPAVAGGGLKDVDFWNPPNTGATNTSFFSARGAGTGYNSAGIGGDACIELENLTYMWTSSMTAGPNKPAFALYHNNTSAALIDLAAEPFPFGSVRCMKDCSTQPSTSNAGPDQLDVEGNYVALAANAPAYGIGRWVIVSDNPAEKQGVFADEWDHNSAFYGYPGETYTLEWQISNECTISADQCLIGFATFNCGDDFVDHRNGKVYPTVQVGDFCWMAKNMDIGEQTPIGNYTTTGSIEKSCYDDDPANCEEYGAFYNWSEAVQQDYTGDYRRGICPVGWFIPTDNAWCNLVSSIDGTVDCGAHGWTGTDAGGKLKEPGIGHWLDPNTGASNLSGFTAFGAGWATKYYSNFGFHELKESARFWTSTHYSSSFRDYWYLGNDEARVGRSYVSSWYDEYSVRCVHYPNLK